jgi:carbon monoxide dehydrogenase subunit G
VKVQGTRSFDAPRETVWQVLNDPEKMAALMPGVESFDVQDDRHWRANVKIPLGLGGLRISFNFEKTDERHPEFASLHAKGTGVGALVSMDTRFHLDEGGSGTDMKWEADVRIAGPVGSMGQRVLQPIVNQQVGNVLNALDKQVSEAAGGEAAPDEKQAPGRAAEKGEKGAEEGIHPASPETYEPEPEGPTHSTDEDS